MRAYATSVRLRETGGEAILVRADDSPTDYLVFAHDRVEPRRVSANFIESLACDEMDLNELKKIPSGRFVARHEQIFRKFKETSRRSPLRMRLQEWGDDDSAVFYVRTESHVVFPDGTAVLELEEPTGPVWMFQGCGVDVSVDYEQSVMWDPNRHSARRARNGMAPSFCDADPCSRGARKGWVQWCPAAFCILEIEVLEPRNAPCELLDRRARVFDYFGRHRGEIFGIISSDEAYFDADEESDWRLVHGAREFLNEYLTVHKYFSCEFTGWGERWSEWRDRVSAAFLRDSVPNAKQDAPRLSIEGKGLLNNARRDILQRLKNARKGRGL